ncbi:ABC transporter permease [Bifidobacterium pseudolongum]|uniref:Binding-protein-dependent transport system inner membrane component n=1 Tax=Bifidobacterium pseudolongum subsp. globosum TaxID=1690 RepID=A0A8B3RN32_9BIFI|nr:ABC transporter permease [Bifidobacterium pseudolongum]RYQ45880.1 Binding-protein-dependent transport system inner membrane component [Bifidobacterium pseudolongum subsp. globosum]RYQ47622.1 Binding-protein-dependent transport system inner membrane component [Bifidobacterium pseudolongum subsp. globosum]
MSSITKDFILDGIPAIPEASKRTKRRPGTPTLWGGVAIIAVLLITGMVVSLWPPYDPYTTSADTFAAPSAAHWLGTDNLGRDLFSRLALSAMTGIAISLSTCLAAAVLGTFIGLTAGYFGGYWDTISMRLMDGLLAIPGILVALIVRVILGAGVWQLILAMSLIYTPVLARVVRAPALRIVSQDYVLASRISALPAPVIIVRHVLRNAVSPLLVQCASIASSTVALESALSYLGQGVQPPQPSAGRMVSEYQIYMQVDPLLVIAPMFVIVMLSFGWNLIADGLQSALLSADDKGR